MTVKELEVLDDSLFDGEGNAEVPTLELNPNLAPWEIEQAKSLRRMTRGVMLITGMPGSGKGLLANVIAWKLKHYFGFRILRDDRPRKLFGNYTPFNEDTLLSDVAKMEEIATGDLPKEVRTKKAKQKLTEQLGKWRTIQGDVMMKNSVILLDEFWRYFHNRRPMNPMGILLGGVVKVWRHLDCLIIGISQQRKELDRFSCLPYVTHEVRVSWSVTRPDTADCTFFPVRYVGSRGILEVTGKKKMFHVNGARPRPELGGARYYDLYNSKSAIALRPRFHFNM